MELGFPYANSYAGVGENSYEADVAKIPTEPPLKVICIKNANGE